MVIFGGDGGGRWHRRCECSLFLAVMGVSLDCPIILFGVAQFPSRSLEFPGLVRTLVHLPPLNSHLEIS